MSDDHGQGTLVDFFQTYAPSRFRTRSGKPLGIRTYQQKIREFQLPVIRVGHGTLIDPERGDAQLRKFEGKPHQPVRRGRPRKRAQS